MDVRGASHRKRVVAARIARRGQPGRQRELARNKGTAMECTSRGRSARSLSRTHGPRRSRMPSGRRRRLIPQGRRRSRCAASTPATRQGVRRPVPAGDFASTEQPRAPSASRTSADGQDLPAAEGLACGVARSLGIPFKWSAAAKDLSTRNLTRRHGGLARLESLSPGLAGDRLVCNYRPDGLGQARAAWLQRHGSTTGEQCVARTCGHSPGRRRVVLGRQDDSRLGIPRKAPHRIGDQRLKPVARVGPR